VLPKYILKEYLGILPYVCTICGTFAGYRALYIRPVSFCRLTLNGVVEKMWKEVVEGPHLI